MEAPVDLPRTLPEIALFKQIGSQRVSKVRCSWRHLDKLAGALKRARTFAMDPRSAPWYYLHVEAYQKGVVEQQGPIPFDELHVMYKDGKVERDTFVWSECHEADDFFQIESVPELVAAL